MEKHDLNEEWLDVVKLAQDSSVSKEEFANFLEEKKNEKKA